MKCPTAQEIVYTIKEKQYFEHIEKAYDYASRLLLDLLMEEKELMPRLRYYYYTGFFLFQWSLYLLDIAEFHVCDLCNQCSLCACARAHEPGHGLTQENLEHA